MHDAAENRRPMDIRKVIVGECERQGISQAELARRADMPQPTVNTYFTGRNDLSGARISAMLRALGLELQPTARRRAR